MILFGTGIKNRTNLQSLKVTVGGIEAPVEYAGAQGTYLGLDQINILLPRSLASKEDVNVEVWVGGIIANTVRVKIR